MIQTLSVAFPRELSKRMPESRRDVHFERAEVHRLWHERWRQHSRRLTDRLRESRSTFQWLERFRVSSRETAVGPCPTSGRGGVAFFIAAPEVASAATRLMSANS
jgi:hypothetical protein